MNLRRRSGRPRRLVKASLLRQWPTPSEAFRDKDLSKLGDALLNLIFSLSLSLSKGCPSGGKIPNRILADALRSCAHQSLVPRHSDKHRKGDIVEAVFAYAWLSGALDVEEAAAQIAGKLDPSRSLPDPEGYARALGDLMDRTLSEMGIDEDL